MPRARFRLRTLLLVIAASAVLMGAHRWLAELTVNAALASVLVLTVIVVIPLLVLACALSFYFRHVRSNGELLAVPAAGRREVTQFGIGWWTIGITIIGCAWAFPELIALLENSCVYVLFLAPLLIVVWCGLRSRPRNDNPADSRE